MRRGRNCEQGFTLTELAVVMAIVGLLLGGLMYTLAAQVEQRGFEETRHRLNQARELLLAFAIVHGRLPCPATSTSNGEEAPVGGGTCTLGTHDGWLPAQTIGFQQTDSEGFAVDPHGNRIRYAVSSALPVNSQSPRICRPVNDATPPVTPHFTHADNMKANGVDCRPSDLLVCKSSQHTPPVTTTTCGGSDNQIVSQNLVAAVVFSAGKNYATAPTAAAASAANRLDEAANLDGDAVFVFHTPTPSDTPATLGGEFDDQLTWITAGELYNRLIAAGVLP